MLKKVVGFDVSSSNVGYSVFEYDKDNIKLIDYGVIKPLKKVNVLVSLLDLKTKVLEILNKHNPDDIAIEEIIQFMKGKSTAKTIITLASFNRMIGLCSMEFLKKEPKMLNVLTIRSKLKVNGKRPAKEEVPAAIEHHLNIKFPWIMKKSRKTKTMEINEQSYDLSDGIAAGLAFIFISK